MPTHRSPDPFDLEKVEGRAVVADFCRGTIASNTGTLLLAKVGRTTDVIRAIG